LIVAGGIRALAERVDELSFLQDQAQQLKAVHDDTSLSPEQKHAKKKAIHESLHEQINGVLTPEQQAKFKQMKQEAMEKHKTVKEGEMDHQ
jgi:Spy/CpxP family protein refolding chaperone